VDVRCLFDVLAVLRGHEDKRGGEYFSDPVFPTFCVLLGEFQSVKGSVIEQDESIFAGFWSALRFPQCDSSTHVKLLFIQIHSVPAKSKGLTQPQPGEENELEKRGIDRARPVGMPVQLLDDGIGLLPVLRERVAANRPLRFTLSGPGG